MKATVSFLVFVFNAYLSEGNLFCHFDNTLNQYTVIFNGCKNDNFQTKICDNFHIFA